MDIQRILDLKFPPICYLVDGFVSCITHNSDLSNHWNIQASASRLFKVLLFNVLSLIEILLCICFLIPQHWEHEQPWNWQCCQSQLLLNIKTFPQYPINRHNRVHNMMPLSLSIHNPHKYTMIILPGRNMQCHPRACLVPHKMSLNKHTYDTMDGLNAADTPGLPRYCHNSRLGIGSRSEVGNEGHLCVITISKQASQWWAAHKFGMPDLPICWTAGISISQMSSGYCDLKFDTTFKRIHLTAAWVSALVAKFLPHVWKPNKIWFYHGIIFCLVSLYSTQRECHILQSTLQNQCDGQSHHTSPLSRHCCLWELGFWKAWVLWQLNRP